MDNCNQDLVELGRCHRPFGLKGDFIIALYNNDESILKKNMKIFVSLKNDEKMMHSYKLESLKFGNKVIARFCGVSSRTEVEKILPFSIWVLKKDFPVVTEEDEFYYQDLRGLEVICAEGGGPLGSIKDIYDNGAQSVLVIEGNRGIFEVPFVEKFVKKVDLELNRVEVIFPDFL